MFNLFKIALIASTLASSVLAEIVPTSPDGNTVVKVGEDIKALWTEDTTGQWTDVEIQLMTGDNLQMVPLAVLATGVDGTTTAGLDIPVPDVTPYSKIYFLQFTRAGDVSTSTWTTRFTIAGADGSTTEPTNSTVYSGNAVQWGTGALVGEAPSVISGGSSNSTSNSTTASTTPSASAAVASVSSAAVSAVSSAEEAVTSTSASASASQSSASASRASAAAAASSSGAAFRKSSVGLGAVVLAFAGVVAL